MHSVVAPVKTELCIFEGLFGDLVVYFWRTFCAILFYHKHYKNNVGDFALDQYNSEVE